MTAGHHVEVAAYVLGVLDEEDNEAFEAHLLDCAGCQAELRDLHVVPDALDALGGAAPPALEHQPHDRVLRGLLDDVTAYRRRRRRSMILLAAAAVTVLIAGPVVTARLWPASTTITSVSGSTEAPGARTVRGVGAAGAAASLVLQPREWGTEVGAELSGIAGPVRCRLVAVSRDGTRESVTSWRIPGGRRYDPADPLEIQGGTGLAAGEIDRFLVLRADGATLIELRL